MTFPEYVTKYVDKTNPATGWQWVRAAILQDSKVDPATLDTWISFTQEFHYQMMQAQKRPPTDAEYIAAWVQAHPVQKPGAIFGPAGQKPTIGQVSQEDYWAKMKALLDALG